MADSKPKARDLVDGLAPLLGTEFTAPSDEKYSTGVPRVAPFIFLAGSAINQVKHNYEHFITTSGKWARVFTQGWVAPFARVAGLGLAAYDTQRKSEDVDKAFGHNLGSTAGVARAGFHTLNTFIIPALVFSLGARGARALRAAGPHMSFIGQGALFPNLVGFAAVGGYITMADPVAESLEHAWTLNQVAAYDKDLSMYGRPPKKPFDYSHFDPKLFGFDPDLPNFMLLEAAPENQMNLAQIRSDLLHPQEVIKLRRGDLPDHTTLVRRRGATHTYDEVALTTATQYYTDALLGLDEVPDVSTPEAFDKTVEETLNLARVARFGDDLAMYGILNRRSTWDASVIPQLNAKETAIMQSMLARHGGDKVLEAAASTGSTMSLDSLLRMANTPEEKAVYHKLVTAHAYASMDELRTLRNKLAIAARSGASPDVLVQIAQGSSFLANSTPETIAQDLIPVLSFSPRATDLARSTPSSDLNASTLISKAYSDLLVYQPVSPPSSLPLYNSVVARKLAKRTTTNASPITPQVDSSLRSFAAKIAADVSNNKVTLSQFKNACDQVIATQSTKSNDDNNNNNNNNNNNTIDLEPLLAYDTVRSVLRASEEDFNNRSNKVNSIMTLARKTGTNDDIYAAKHLKPLEDILFSATITGLQRLASE